MCSVSLIGSHARGTAGPESDIDLLLDLAPDATFGLIDLVQLKDTLADALGRNSTSPSRAPLAPMSKRA